MVPAGRLLKSIVAAAHKAGVKSKIAITNNTTRSTKARILGIGPRPPIAGRDCSCRTSCRAHDFAMLWRAIDEAGHGRLSRDMSSAFVSATAQRADERRWT